MRRTPAFVLYPFAVAVTGGIEMCLRLELGMSSKGLKAVAAIE